MAWRDSLREESVSKPEVLEMVPVNPSPCTLECPLGTNVKAYISLIAARRFSEALEVVRKTNPFPGICGRVCPHPCENECKRALIDEPIAIAALKRFIADYELRRGIVPAYMSHKSRKERIAVIGAGPAGLTCAADLAREGYRVTIFEALSAAGGMMAFGIPAYRLPRDILRIEVAAIEALGVEIRLNTPIGTEPSFDAITRDFDAVFIAAGAQIPLSLGITGEEEVAHGMIDWVTLLREVSSGRGKKPGDSVVVIGGGNTAVDCARVALRLGAKNVQVLYRRSRKEMPAYENEISEAQEEGVGFRFLSSPVQLLHENGSLIGIECERTRLGKKDESGRRRAIPIQDSRFTIPCDAVIPAVGQQLDVSFARKGNRPGVSGEGLIVVDPDTMSTKLKGVFSGGDAVTGASSVVDAIASGHRAARSIDRYLKGLPLKKEDLPINPEIREFELEGQPANKASRMENTKTGIAERVHSFTEIEQGMTEREAVEEAKRCIRCGPCMECVECVGVCERAQAIVKYPDRSERIVRFPQDIGRKSTSSLKYGSRHFEPALFTVSIDERLCRGCGECEEVCGYDAMQVLYCGDGVFTARVNEDVCRGCGTCVSVCPTNAIEQQYFTRERMGNYIDEAGKSRGTAVFACRWSSWMRSTAGRPEQEALSVMCTGRVTAGDILNAIARGARGVLIIACDDDECHYGFGKSAAKESVKRAADILSLLGHTENMIGIVDMTASDDESHNPVEEEIEKLKKIKGRAR
jgi:NADPH-dependent glutamate synthase beta subunit-like oxidoreductase/coenzyme F420-reducing hydrogenase delta subunit